MGGKATAEQRRKWKRENPEAERTRRRKPAVKERLRKAAHDYRIRMGQRMLLQYAKTRAKKTNLSFELPPDWKSEVTHCEWSGLPFVKNDPMYAASIDRIDNDLGYTIDNCRLILRGLNVFKNKHDQTTINTVLAALCQPNGERP